MPIRTFIKKIRVSRVGIQRAADKALSSKQVKDIGHQKAQERVRQIQSQALNEFNNHPVTTEIEGGANAANESGTILGAMGNLYTFIGFPDGSQPTQAIRNYLLSKGKVFRYSRFVRRHKGGQLIFRVDIPRPDQIHALSPLPWEPSRSWTRGVEKGISGIGSYIYKSFIKASRSGSAIQAKGLVHNGTFKATKYLSTILGNYYAKMKGLR